MKLGIYVKPNVYNNQNSNNVHSTNAISLQRKTHSQDIITFGHYLDDELARLQRQKEELQKKRRETSVDTQDIDARGTRQASQLDETIDQARSSTSSLSTRLERLHNIKYSKDREIAQLEAQGQTLEGKVEKNSSNIEKLERKQKELLEKMKRDNEIAEKRRLEALELATTRANEEFKQQVDAVLNNPKNTLTQRVLHPMILEAQGHTVIIPGGILIESESPDVARNVFEWITKKTNSNYITINATSFEDKRKLFEIINHVAKKAQKEFESGKKRTLIFIENFENCGVPNSENQPIIGALKSFLDKCSKDYHSTIVISTSDPSKLDKIVTADHRFQVKVKLDNDFMQNNELGYNSILKEAKETKFLGNELDISSIELIVNRAMKRLKRIFSFGIITKAKEQKVTQDTGTVAKPGLAISAVQPYVPQLPKEKITRNIDPSSVTRSGVTSTSDQGDVRRSPRQAPTTQASKGKVGSTVTKSVITSTSDQSDIRIPIYPTSTKKPKGGKTNKQLGNATRSSLTSPNNGRGLKRPHFTQEFKKEIVKALKRGELTPEDVIFDHGIDPKRLLIWCKLFK